MGVINDPDHYSNHLEFLKEAKYDYINKHSIIPMVCDFINNTLDKSSHQLKNEQFTISPEKSNFFQKIKKIESLNKWYKKLLLLF
jgi:hypothetical protein